MIDWYSGVWYCSNTSCWVIICRGARRNRKPWCMWSQKTYDGRHLCHLHMSKLVIVVQSFILVDWVSKLGLTSILHIVRRFGTSLSRFDCTGKWHIEPLCVLTFQFGVNHFAIMNEQFGLVVPLARWSLDQQSYFMLNPVSTKMGYHLQVGKTSW